MNKIIFLLTTAIVAAALLKSAQTIFAPQRSDNRNSSPRSSLVDYL